MHLYFHVPFCKQACNYCDFHFSTSLGQKGRLVEAMRTEIRMQRDYLPTQPLETIYLGGGTPSLLTETELTELFATIHEQFAVSPTAEITLEANPDDLTDANLRLFRRFVNRLSIGIQTFDEATLCWMNRAHTATEAANCVDRARQAGFTNMSVDLIYGLIYGVPPLDRVGLNTNTSETQQRWRTDLEKILLLNVPHISAYALTIEPDTAFGRWQQKGKLPAMDEELAAVQFEELVVALRTAGYEHYEISNFAKPDHYARHNTAYWQRRSYLGIGPSAHSYNGHSRQYNIAHNPRYIAEIGRGVVPAEVETLTPADRVNEYLLTGLRTQWGCSLTDLNQLLGDEFTRVMQSELAELYTSGWLRHDGDRLLLTDSGKLFADRVAATLFVD